MPLTYTSAKREIWARLADLVEALEPHQLDGGRLAYLDDEGAEQPSWDLEYRVVTVLGDEVLTPKSAEAYAKARTEVASQIRKKLGAR